MGILACIRPAGVNWRRLAASGGLYVILFIPIQLASCVDLLVIITCSSYVYCGSREEVCSAQFCGMLGLLSIYSGSGGRLYK